MVSHSHGGYAVCGGFLWGLIRVAPSQVKTHPCLLFGPTNVILDVICLNEPETFPHLKNSDLRSSK